MDVGIQGEPGSNSARAVELLKGPGARLTSCRTFTEVFSGLGSRFAQAVVPLQNSLAGLVGEVADQLFDPRPCWVEAALTLPIEFVIGALPGATPKRVLAHPVAAAQCGAFLGRMGWEVVPCHDTAGAARLVREQGDPRTVALCPPAAIALHGLTVLAAGCTDAPDSATQFLLLSSQQPPPGTVQDRSLVTVVPHVVLSGVLQAVAGSGVEVLAVHSRPRQVPRRFSAALLLELGEGPSDPRVGALVHRLAQVGATRLLGGFTAEAPR